MLDALKIGVGLWLGGLFLIGTVWAFCSLKDALDRRRRYNDEAVWKSLVEVGRSVWR